MVEPAGDVGVHWLEPMFGTTPIRWEIPKVRAIIGVELPNMNKYGVMDSTRPRRRGDMRMTHADMANHQASTCANHGAWGFQEVSRKTWQIMDLDMANY